MNLAALMIAASVVSTSYDCTLDVPANLFRGDNKAEVVPIKLPPDYKWAFGLTVFRSQSDVQAEITWPGNPMQIAGKFAALSTAKDAIAFAPFSGGPCLFTETGCLALVQVAEQPDGTANIFVTPAALATDRERDVRSPFLVVAEGKCVRKGNSQ